MFSSPFLPVPAGLEIATVNMRDDLLVVGVVSTKMRACCPLCFCPAERRHSQYTRLVADLPCAGFRVQLILSVRRFFCDNADCIRKITTRTASRLRSAVGTSHGPSLRGSSISWPGYLWRVGNPARSSSRYANVANNDPSSSHDSASRSRQIGDPLRHR
jgi:hypothetical protein